MSANSAVTVLRSPSIASDATPSAATRICDLGEETVVEAATFVGPIAVPHFLQNRAPRTHRRFARRTNQLQLRSAFFAERGITGVIVVAGRTAHRVSCGPRLKAQPGADGGRSSALLERAAEWPINGAQYLNHTPYQIGSLTPRGLSPSYQVAWYKSDPYSSTFRARQPDHLAASCDKARQSVWRLTSSSSATSTLV